MKYGDQETVNLLWPGLEDWQCQCRRKEWEWWSLWMKWTSATTTSEKRKKSFERRLFILVLKWHGGSWVHKWATLGQAQFKLRAFKFYCTRRFCWVLSILFIYLLKLAVHISFHWTFSCIRAKVCHMTQFYKLRCENAIWILPSLPWLEICHTEQIHICLLRNRCMAGYHGWSRGRAWRKPW